MIEGKDNKNLGWIGTGIMGNPMCQRLLERGYTLFLFNRTKAKALPLINKGAIWCSTPAEVAENSQIVFSIVNTPEDVEEIISNLDGLLKNLTENSVVIEMSTSSPELATKLYKLAKKRKVNFLDAPVTGGEYGAMNGELTIMVGGDYDVFDKASPLLEIFAKSIHFMGSGGSGCKAKICNQILSGSIIFFVEATLMAKRMNLDYEKVIEAIGGGFGGSQLVRDYGEKISKDDYMPGFSIKNFIKDISIIKNQAASLKIELPGINLVEKLINQAIDLNWSEQGIHSLYRLAQKSYKKIQNKRRHD